MLGCNESNIVFQQHLCTLGQLRRSNGPPHFRTFCELVEGEENKLATFSTWTIGVMIIFQQHLCGNSGEAMVEIHKYSVKQ